MLSTGTYLTAAALAECGAGSLVVGVRCVQAAAHLTPPPHQAWAQDGLGDVIYNHRGNGHRRVVVSLRGAPAQRVKCAGRALWVIVEPAWRWLSCWGGTRSGDQLLLIHIHGSLWTS